MFCHETLGNACSASTYTKSSLHNIVYCQVVAIPGYNSLIPAAKSLHLLCSSVQHRDYLHCVIGSHQFELGRLAGNTLEFRKYSITVSHLGSLTHKYITSQVSWGIYLPKSSTTSESHIWPSLSRKKGCKEHTILFLDSANTMVSCCIYPPNSCLIIPYTWLLMITICSKKVQVTLKYSMINDWFRVSCCGYLPIILHHTPNVCP